MVRVIVLILLVVFAVWAIRRAIRATRMAEKKPSVQQDLVRCARCGVHLPRGEAREAGGRLYCGEEHARLGVDSGAGS
jgi:uncharacterized protein